METLTIQQKLLRVQSELKAPKNQYNAFGKYKYRSQEGILEAVKPLLLKYELNMIITDDLVEVAGLAWVKSTAKAFTDNTEPIIEATGFGAFDEDRKGMDKAQSTGSSSSYSRKYALNGLFLIDDSMDPDVTNTHNTAPSAGKESLPKSGEKFQKAKDFIKNGGSMESIKAKYQVTKQVEQLLLS